MRVQAEAQDRMTVLRHGGAPPLEAESEGGRRPECTGQRLVRTPDPGRPACARNSHSDASSKHQSQHRRPRQGEAKGLEVTGGLSVGKEEKKMKQFPVESSGR